MAQVGDGKLLEAESTEANTISGVGSLLAQTEPKKESPAGVVISTETAKVSDSVQVKADDQKPKAKVNLGTLEERLAMLQDAARNYQRVGGKIRIGHVGQPKVTLVIALDGVMIEDNLWLLASDDKPKAKEPKDTLVVQAPV